MRLQLDAEMGVDFQDKYKDIPGCREVGTSQKSSADQQENGQAGGATRSLPGRGVTLKQHVVKLIEFVKRNCCHGQ